MASVLLASRRRSLYLCLLHLFTHTRVSKDILAALKWEGCASGEAASESCFSQLPSVAFSPPSCSDAALFSNWMTNCCVCGLLGHESGVPTMRWKGIIGTTIAVSLLCFTPLDSAVYTVLTRETDTGTSVRLGLWRHKPHTPTDVCLGGRLLGSSASTTVPKAGQAGVNRRRPCSAHHRKSNEAASWSCFFTKKASPLTDQ